MRETLLIDLHFISRYEILIAMVGKGRRKIEMKLIDSKAARKVCFSKRRSGLFKKAEELSILCGAKVGVVAFSISGKPMVFNASSLDSLLDPQDQICFDLPSLQEPTKDWESAFCNAMTGKATPFWWEKVDLQCMEMDELLRFDNALIAYKEKQLKEKMMDFDSSQVQQTSCGEKGMEEMMDFDASQMRQLSCDEKGMAQTMDFWGLQMEQTPMGSESPSLATIDTSLDPLVLEQLLLQYMWQ